jgi:hypothetical protein
MSSEPDSGLQGCDAVLLGDWFLIQVVLILCQGYNPEKHRANRTQNSRSKQCISWRLGD